ncbi:MAG: 6,7-dimethyl-8-ribityllumazine synthase [Pseudomonadota bacterium]
MQIHREDETPALHFQKPPHVLLLEARFYTRVNDLLVDGARSTLEKFNATHELMAVPGALEIPSALQFAAQRKTGKPFDAFVVLGCIIRGETYHYDIVCNESARGLMDVALRLGLAVGNGILTVGNEAQALERADKSRLDKGGGAVLAALSIFYLKLACGAEK